VLDAFVLLLIVMATAVRMSIVRMDASRIDFLESTGISIVIQQMNESKRLGTQVTVTKGLH
jgi:anti-anti-sigma regulatory factor